MAITALDSVALVGAGALAGLVGSAGGITTLVSYPALLAVGLPGRAANLANNVALLAFAPGAALSSQPELQGWGGWLRRWAVVALLGGAVGAVLLLSTPPGVFARIVPFLIAGGSLALLFEPRLTQWRLRRTRSGAAGGRAMLPVLLFALSVYNGYFGAGSGVMILTLMLILVDRRLPTANALKNMLLGAAQILSAAIYALSGSVRWPAVWPLALGLLIGSSIGPVVARRLPARLLRWLIALLGLGLAVRLWVAPGM